MRDGTAAFLGPLPRPRHDLAHLLGRESRRRTATLAILQHIQHLVGQNLLAPLISRLAPLPLRLRETLGPAAGHPTHAPQFPMCSAAIKTRGSGSPSRVPQRT